MSMPSIAAGPGWPTWFHTKSSPPNALAVRRTMSRAKSSSQVASQRQRLAAGRGDLGANLLDPGLVDIGYPDRRALAGKAQRPGPPHPRGRRGDNADLVWKAHGCSSTSQSRDPTQHSLYEAIPSWQGEKSSGAWLPVTYS